MPPARVQHLWARAAPYEEPDMPRRKKDHASQVPREEPVSNDLSQYLSIRQTADLMGVDPDHVNRLLLAGKLRGVKPGG